MGTRRGGRAVRACVGLGAAALLMVSAACSSGAGSQAGAPSPSSTAPDAGSADEAQLADQSACQGVQDVFLRLAAVSSTWKPARDPFDARIEAALGPMILELHDQARNASTDSLRVVVDRSADALGALQAGMVSGQRPRVTAALAQTRHAYAALPSCAHRDGSPGPVPSSGSTTPAAGSSPTAAAGAFQKDPGCVAGREAYAELGPVTSTWNEGAHPFDPSTARALRHASTALLAASRLAKAPVVREDLHANAAAIELLAVAMGARNRAQVSSMLADVQHTAVTLAGVCPLT